MTLKLIAKDNYGTLRYYPANEEAKIFARIAGTKTLTDYTIQRIKDLGLEVLVAPWAGEKF